MNVLMLGDVFGRPGRRAVGELLPQMRKDRQIDFVVINGENAAGGKGLTDKACDQFFEAGVDAITSGNHILSKREIEKRLNEDARLLRPHNYHESMAGRGVGLYMVENSNLRVGVINLAGCVHMNKARSPFRMAPEIIEELKKETPIILVDFHAEVTSEKRAMGWFLDGKVSAVVGSHTHVQTADEEILPLGTAYITDLGMTGPYHSVIGLKKELGLARFLTGERGKFDVGKGDTRLCGALITIRDDGTSEKIERLRIPLED